VIRGLDIVSIPGVEHQGERDKGSRVKLLFDEFQGDHAYG
jgi:hypothetical protein